MSKDRCEAIPPLEWPTGITDPSPLQKVLMGLPLMGVDMRAYDSFRDQLRSRPENTAKYWNMNDSSSQKRKQICKILAEELDWPDGRFVPEDPCDILLFDPKDGYDAARAILRMEEEVFRSELDIDNLRKLTIGELVRLASAQPA